MLAPNGAITLIATLYGASGATPDTNMGKGAKISANIPVTSGQTIRFYIGGRGVFKVGGFNGGGYGFGTTGVSFAGGGATDIRLNGFALSNRVLVAGGGGGSTGFCTGSSVPGGGGGYPSGFQGAQCSTYPVGGPGTASGGGLASDPTYCTSINDGSLGEGGHCCGVAGESYGGAGGGGYYGGAGAHRSAGGGGSSYSQYGVTSYADSFNSGHGYAEISFLFAPTADPSLIEELPTQEPTAELAESNEVDTKTMSALLIGVYVLCGIFALWCAYKLLVCYVQAANKREMLAKLDAIRVTASRLSKQTRDLHQEDKPLLLPRQSQEELLLPGIGASAGGVPIQTAKPAQSVSSADSSSIMLSSLHSSEMSDVEYSFDSDEPSSVGENDVSQIMSTKESVMEEGRGDSLYNNIV
eukprot:gene10952-12778_t